MKKEKEQLTVKTLPISALQISDCNVRKERDSDKIAELAKSIQEEGILQPLLVRPENQHYGIVIGSRRFSAAKKANILDVPAIIKELTDEESRLISVVENLQRNDLQPRETVQAICSLLKPLGNLTQRELAAKLGKSKGYIFEMAGVAQLLGKLEESGTEVKMYPKEQETRTKKAIPLYHAVSVADAFRGPELEPILKQEPDKDLEVAKAVTNTSQENLYKVIREFKKHPEDDIVRIVQDAEMGLLDNNEVLGHASDYLGGRGEDNIDVKHYEFQINYHAANLCEYLTNIHHMPEPTDDVEVDYIRKSRPFRKMLVSELNPTTRAGVHERLNYLSKLIEETMDEIEELQKKEK